MNENGKGLYLSVLLKDERRGAWVAPLVKGQLLISARVLISRLFEFKPCVELHVHKTKQKDE